VLAGVGSWLRGCRHVRRPALDHRHSNQQLRRLEYICIDTFLHHKRCRHNTLHNMNITLPEQYKYSVAQYRYSVTQNKYSVTQYKCNVTQYKCYVAQYKSYITQYKLTRTTFEHTAIRHASCSGCATKWKGFLHHRLHETYRFF